MTEPEPELTITLPAMYFPMPWLVHPDLALLERQGLAFMERHGLCTTPGRRERTAETRSALFFAGNCPGGDRERLQMAVDWTYLMFLFDDLACDEESAGDALSFLDLAVRIVRTFEQPAAGVLDPANAFTSAVTDLATRLHRLASPAQCQRLVAAHRTWFLGVAWERAARREQLVPTLDDYLFTRLMNVAGFATLSWFQISAVETIPDGEITDPAVQAVTEMACMVAALDDDLYSYGKELWFARRRDGGEAPFPNSVRLYEHHERCTLEKAQRHVAELRDRILHRFLDVAAAVRTSASPVLNTYVDNLTHLIRSNYEWGVRAGRYTNPDGRHPRAIALIPTLTGTPGAVGAPPGLPSVAGWWHPFPLL
ncbi:terpene synthase family protein [Streptomyces sp. NPDC089919]|uniref:terpene synthase family protein n=1 Tax=Streptomyces sp. NPDC089919 TaxID=3155188 RepID=UPI00343B4229